jgi:prolipoprotein diacylglyceryltransferase
MSVVVSVITIGIDPTIEAGPVEIAWHGFTVAIGVVIGGIAVAYDARRRGDSCCQKRSIDDRGLSESAERTSHSRSPRALAKPRCD